MGYTSVDKSRTLATQCRKAAEVATVVKGILEFLRDPPSEKIGQLAQSGKTTIETDEACKKLYNNLSKSEREEVPEIIRHITKFAGIKVVFTGSKMTMVVEDPAFNNDDSLTQQGIKNLRASA